MTQSFKDLGLDLDVAKIRLYDLDCLKYESFKDFSTFKTKFHFVYAESELTIWLYLCAMRWKYYQDHLDFENSPVWKLAWETANNVDLNDYLPFY